ncbi:MAG: AMP-binding protein [Parasphingorhabdus sp.]
MHERAETLASGLLGEGLKPGDRVGIWSPNNMEWALTQFATAKAGLILVNINPAYRTNEAEYALRKVGCHALIMAPRFKTSDYVTMMHEIVPELQSAKPGALCSEALPELRLVVTIGEERFAGCLPFAALTESGATRHAFRTALKQISAELSADDPINIQFTSGTTGFPKGATLTHRNILNNGYFVGARIKLGAKDRLCIPVPLYHCFGMVMGNLACLTHGATMVYPTEGFDPIEVLKTIPAEKCTALYGVPTMFIAILGHPEFERFDLTSLRTGIMAGALCPIATMREVMDRMHMSEVTIAYGMTETSPVSFQSDVDDPLEERVTTVGRIQPHLEAKVIDDKGETLPRGQSGELCTRGYSVMQGYWNDPERTAEAIDADGWMHTGDIGAIDENGYCRITGRIKDMIIRGGENIYPREIEEFLMTHAAIADAQVIGVPDEKYGEELCAWIMLRDDQTLSEDEIKSFCGGKIAHYKVPRHIRFVTGFPMTVTGKVQKFEMRKMMQDELGVT